MFIDTKQNELCSNSTASTAKLCFLFLIGLLRSLVVSVIDRGRFGPGRKCLAGNQLLLLVVSSPVYTLTGVLVFSRLTFSRPIHFRDLTCSRPTLSLPVHVRYLTFSLPVLFATRISSQNNRYNMKKKNVIFTLYLIYLKLFTIYI